MTGGVEIGTASWVEKTLIASKRFVRARCSVKDRLSVSSQRWPVFSYRPNVTQLISPRHFRDEGIETLMFKCAPICPT